MLHDNKLIKKFLCVQWLRSLSLSRRLSSTCLRQPTSSSNNNGVEWNVARKVNTDPDKEESVTSIERILFIRNFFLSFAIPWLLGWRELWTSLLDYSIARSPVCCLHKPFRNAECNHRVFVLLRMACCCIKHTPCVRSDTSWSALAQFIVSGVGARDRKRVNTQCSTEGMKCVNIYQ